MMINRRTFLTLLGGPAIPAATLADGQVTRWLQAIYSTDPAAPAPYKPEPNQWASNTLTVSWIGQSTVLINFFGTTILTDPVFSDRVGIRVAGLFTIGPKRLVAPALRLDELPRIDLVLLSHIHMDHCDTETLRSLSRTTKMVVPANTSGILGDLGFTHVAELAWSRSTPVAGLTIEALPVRHKGARYPWEFDHSEDGREGQGTNAYLISRNGIPIVFCGDTAYCEHFGMLRQREVPVALAILPIGGYIPHHDNHCTPEEALLMADEMNARHVLPIHWGTFPGEEPLREPIERLTSALGSAKERLALDDIGKTFVFPG